MLRMPLLIALPVFCLMTSSVALAEVFVNEIHNDDPGADNDEGVEIAGLAGTDLAGWQIVLYNGQNGAPYNTVNLTGIIPDQGGCIGTVNFPIVGIQNGTEDGLALVDPGGAVVELLSWEGTLMALSGVATGMTAVDIGVDENAAAEGDSLQLTGTGNTAADFTWTGPIPHTRDLPNTGQTFTSHCPLPVGRVGCGH